MTRSVFHSLWQLLPVIHRILPHWSKTSSSSSSLHCILVLPWCEVVRRARLEWIRCSASDRWGLLTNPGWFFNHPSLQRTGPEGGSDRCSWTGGPEGTSLPFTSSSLGFSCSGNIVLVWRLFFNSDLHATYLQKECGAVHNKICLKNTTVKTHFKKRSRQRSEITWFESLTRSFIAHECTWSIPGTNV